MITKWNDMLDIISRALSENGISSTRVGSSKAAFQKSIDKFRREKIQVLLLPVKTGANGLNLVEATNVFLVEPLLHESVEKQAINRVHRLGQTKPTQVFRFIVKDTIEQKVFNLSKQRAAVKEKWKAKEEVTVDDIRSLFADTNEFGEMSQTDSQLEPTQDQLSFPEKVVEEPPSFSFKDENAAKFWSILVVYPR